ncbi:Metallopeptidase family M24 [Ceratobasidium sp. AG-Ba]|nr:Metallopeptidase family M24 [Ceratobasidium sp. AG-Ba]
MAGVFPARTHIAKTVEHLFRLLPDVERVKTQVLLLSGSTTPFRNDTDRELALRQESNFFYLSGCDVANSHLLITARPPGHNPLANATTTSTGSSIHSTLFIPREDPLETMWSPPPPTLDEVRKTHDAHDLAYSDEFVSKVTSTLPQLGSATIHILPQTAQFPNVPATVLTQLAVAGLTPPPVITYLLPALHSARLIKTPYEIDLIREANAISSRAHEVIMRVLGKDMKEVGGKVNTRKADSAVMPGQWRIEKEAEAEAVFVASCRREGSVHQAYMPIVASAQHAATLHYCCNDRAFAWGPINADRRDLQVNRHEGHTHNGIANGHQDEPTLAPQVLLLDAGCEWRNYASDITRTTPVGNGGRFTSEARAIYQLVLKMQNEAIESLKPGLHWDAVQLQCHKTLVNGFLKLGIFKGDASAILDSEVSSAFYPHGVGHSLGLDVHDVPSASKPEPVTASGTLLALGPNVTTPVESIHHPSFYRYLRLRLPLVAGMVLTVEPGIYFSPHLLAPVRNSPFIDHEVLAKYESVGGVRIEDVLVITENGSENLTTVGKEVEWIERLSSGEV